MVREYSPQTRPNQGQNYPPLQSGDSPLETLRERLTRPEFERRYAASPHIKKAELIEGIVYVASPVQLLKLTASPDRTVLYSLVLCPLRL